MATFDADELLAAADAVLPAAVELRRRIHSFPEQGLDLPRTQQAVLEALEPFGFEVRTGQALTSVVADVVGARPGPTVLLRGDMDALPMPEDTGLDFASTVEGAMHACGHDAHTAMLAAAGVVPQRVVGALDAEELVGRLAAHVGVHPPRQDAVGGLHVVCRSVAIDPEVVRRFSRGPGGAPTDAPCPLTVIGAPHGPPGPAFALAEGIARERPGRRIRVLASCASLESSWPQWARECPDLVVTEIGSVRAPSRIAAAAEMTAAIKSFLDDVLDGYGVKLAPDGRVLEQGVYDRGELKKELKP